MWYEYQIAHFAPDCEVSVIEVELNELGAQGWHIVGQSQNTRGSIIYTLERAVIQEVQDEQH